MDLYVYLLPSIHKEQVVLSPQQKRLLGINDNGKKCKLLLYIAETNMITEISDTISTFT